MQLRLASTYVDEQYWSGSRHRQLRDVQVHAADRGSAALGQLGSIELTGGENGIRNALQESRSVLQTLLGNCKR